MKRWLGKEAFWLSAIWREEFPGSKRRRALCFENPEAARAHPAAERLQRESKGRSKIHAPAGFRLPGGRAGLWWHSFLWPLIPFFELFSLSLISRAMPSRRSTSCWVKSRALAPWARRSRCQAWIPHPAQRETGGILPSKVIGGNTENAATLRAVSVQGTRQPALPVADGALGDAQWCLAS